jgi:hypothetical protein
MNKSKKIEQTVLESTRGKKFTGISKYLSIITLM